MFPDTEIKNMTVIKRDRGSSKESLLTELSKFCDLLMGQGEDDAVKDLQKARDILSKASLGGDDQKMALKIIEEAFGDEHELEAYTVARDRGGDWGDAEELALVSSRVLNLMKRLR